MTQEKGVAETRWLDVNGHEFEQTPTDSGGPRSLHAANHGVTKSQT